MSYVRVTLDARIALTMGADENASLNDCFYEKKDWRACKDEVGDILSGLGGSAVGRPDLPTISLSLPARRVHY